jgi:hypothetical protein
MVEDKQLQALSSPSDFEPPSLRFLPQQPIAKSSSRQAAKAQNFSAMIDIKNQRDGKLKNYKTLTYPGRTSPFYHRDFLQLDLQLA